MPRSPEAARPREAGITPICVRSSAEQRERWTAALRPGETMSVLVRESVEAELERRQEEARELEVEGRAADPFGLEALLERARSRTPR